MGFQIAFIGVNAVSASIGLALGEYQEKIVRIGVDRDNDALKKAQKMGAVDKTTHNLTSAVREADVIVLAEPLDQLQVSIDSIAVDLNPGVHLLDVSGVKEAINQHLEKAAPDFHNHINLSLVVNPDHIHKVAASIDDACADLFKDGLMVIGIPQGTTQETVDLAGTMARLLKMREMFADPIEIDGLQAAAHFLPLIMASTTMNIASDQAGWREAHKLVNAPFMLTTNPVLFLQEGASEGAEWLAEKDNLIRYIDHVSQELQEIRNDISQGDVKSIASRIDSARESYADLHKRRKNPSQDDGGDVKVHIPDSGETIRRLFGFGRKK